MTTQEEFQKAGEVLVEPINTFIAENEWQWELPTKTRVYYKDNKVSVELKYEFGWIGWKADTIDEIKSQIMHDMLQVLQF